MENGGIRLDQNNYKETYKKLIRRFIVASLLLIAILFFKQSITQYQIVQEKQTSRIINLAGRQRMLSQKIVKNIAFIHTDMLGSKNDLYKADLAHSLEVWQKSHLELIELNEADGFFKKADKDIGQMFQDIEASLMGVKNGAEGFLGQLKEGSKAEKELDFYIGEVVKNEAIFLEKMDAIVFLYDEKAVESLQTMRATHTVLFILIITILIFIVITMFIPLLRYANKSFWRVQESNDNLIKIFQTMKGALFITKADGKMIFINSDGQKMLAKEAELDQDLYLKTSLNWMAFDIQHVIDEVKNDGSRVEGVETVIEDKKGQMRSVTISAVAGTYDGQEVVILSLYDITDQKKAEEALKNAAIRDELTGLYNRHFLEGIVEGELGRAERYQIPLSASLLDLDYFKKVNDQWGHPVGDTVLTQVADILKNNIRKSDFAFRIGGEEFLILMPNTDAKGAVTTAEKLRRAIEETAHPVIGKFTASFGVAERALNEKYQSLYNRIDEALYKAKESSRNRVILSEGPSRGYTAIFDGWNDHWNSGEPVIDAQHKGLFQMVGELAQKAKPLDNKEHAIEQINHIIREVKTHFKYEEKVLVQVKYTNAYGHQKIHNQLIEDMKRIKDEVETGALDVKEAYDLIFEDVIVGHLLFEDVTFYPWIQNSDM